MNKRMVAWHEAGHAVVGRHLGLPVTRVGIWQTKYKCVDGRRAFKLWEGETRANFNSLSVPDQRIASVAGAMAVYCWEEAAPGRAISQATGEYREPPFDIDRDAIRYLMSSGDWTINNVTLDPGMFSDAEETLWDEAMEQVYSLLNPKTGPLWRELKNEADTIRRRGFVTTLDRKTFGSTDRVTQ